MPVAAAMPAAAIAGPIVGGLISASAARSAASAAADAAQRATEEAAVARREAQARLEPWRKSGEQANNRLARMLGLDGQPASDFASEDPGYAFRLQEGQRQVDNSAAARGSTLSGGALKALQRYGQGMASQEFQNSFNRLSNVSTQGQNSAAGQASNDMAFGQQQGANTRAAGDAYGAGQLGQANAWSGAIQGSVNNYQDNQMMNLLNNRGRSQRSFGSAGMDNHFFGNGRGGD